MKELLKKILSISPLSIYYSARNFIISRIDVKNGNWSKIDKTSESCIVIANGPSTKEIMNIDLEKLSKKIDIITLNYSISNKKIPTKAHILADPEFFQEKDTISESVKNFYDVLNLYTDRINLYVPHHYYQCAVKNVKNKNISIFSFPTSQHEYGIPSKKEIETGLFGFGAQTVTISAICMALASGYKKIYVIGFDLNYSFIVDKDLKLYVIDSHFYEDKNKVYIEWKILEFYKALYRMHFESKNIQTYIKKYGIEIYNLSEESCIDVFKKLSLDEFLKNENI